MSIKVVRVADLPVPKEFLLSLKNLIRFITKSGVIVAKEVTLKSVPYKIEVGRLPHSGGFSLKILYKGDAVFYSVDFDIESRRNDAYILREVKLFKTGSWVDNFEYIVDEYTDILHQREERRKREREEEHNKKFYLSVDDSQTWYDLKHKNDDNDDPFGFEGEEENFEVSNEPLFTPKEIRDFSIFMLFAFIFFSLLMLLGVV